MFLRKTFTYDVFLSHAVEDKKAIADELNRRLEEENIRVWYSGKKLVTGRDVAEQVREGLYNARFGVVIFSPEFFASIWTITELGWLESREQKNLKVILPVVHNMTIEELGGKRPGIAGRFCIEANKKMDFVVTKIVDEVNEERRRRKKQLFTFLKWASLIIIGLLTLSSYIGYRYYTNHPDPIQVKQTIEQRIQTFLNTIESKYSNPLRMNSSLVAEPKIDSLVYAYQNFKSYYRNEYEFNDGFRTIRGRKNVETALLKDLVQLADQPGYGMDSVDIYLTGHTRFSLLNKRPVTYTTECTRDGSTYIVKVSYTNALRYIDVLLTLPTTSSGTKRHEMTLVGFLPSETFYFEEGNDGDWYFKAME